MNRIVLVLLFGLSSAGIALALQTQQVEPPRPGQRRPPPAETGPQGEQKLRWICKQLRLDEKQMQTAEALIQVYKAEIEEQKKDPSALLQRIQDKYAEVRAAQSDGNTELAKKLQAELKELAPGTQAESHFFKDLEPALNPDQKEKLPAVRKKAETVGDVSMRPVHVIRAARKLGLSAEQDQKVESILEEYRKNIASNKPDSPEASAERVDKLVQDVRAVLTPAQAQAFDKGIEELREAAPPATALPAAAGPPTTQPEPTPAEPGKK
jgi:uncharacterized membrane-anchored protein YhcB (DUF1043 family)